MRSVKLARLVRYFFFSAEAVTIAQSAAAPLAKSFGVAACARARADR
jgi:hypothetical protein